MLVPVIYFTVAVVIDDFHTENDVAVVVVVAILVQLVHIDIVIVDRFSSQPRQKQMRNQIDGNKKLKMK